MPRCRCDDDDVHIGLQGNELYRRDYRPGPYQRVEVPQSMELRCICCQELVLEVTFRRQPQLRASSPARLSTPTGTFLKFLAFETSGGIIDFLADYGRPDLHAARDPAWNAEVIHIPKWAILRRRERELSVSEPPAVQPPTVDCWTSAWESPSSAYHAAPDVQAVTPLR